MEEQLVRLPRAEAEADPTAAATVVEAARFAGEAKSVAQLVATAPGVAVNDYGGLGQLSTVSIRGSTADGVLVLVDGIPLNGPFGGGVDLSTIPRAWASRIEVVRGPEGAHYGAGALGGVVNVVTPAAGSPGWGLELQGGAFETARLAGDLSLALPGGRALLLAVTGETTGGRFPWLFDPTPTQPGDPLQPRVRANNAARRAGALAKAGGPVAGGRGDALLQATAGRRELPGFPWALTPRDWQEDGRVLAALRWARAAAEGLTVAARGHLRLDWLDARLGAPASEPWRQRGLGAGAAAEARLAHPGGLVAAELQATADRLRAGGLGDRTRLGASLALSEEATLAGGRLRLAPALRGELAGPFAGVSAKLGASWRLAGPLAVRASAGRTFRAPSLAELHLQQGLILPNPDLRSEVGLAVDAGLVYDGPLGLGSLGGHATRYRDLVLYEPTTLGRLKPFNAGEALVTGLEAEVATAPLAGPLRASLAAAWTWQRAEILAGLPAEVGNDVPYRPRHRLFARAGVAPGRLAAHLEAHWVGRRYEDRYNDRPIPATLAWNAGGSLRLADAPALRLSLDVQNLADDRTLDDGFGNPLPSRMVMVTVSAGPTPRGPP